MAKSSTYRKFVRDSQVLVRTKNLILVKYASFALIILGLLLGFCSLFVGGVYAGFGGALLALTGFPGVYASKKRHSVTLWLYLVVLGLAACVAVIIISYYALPETTFACISPKCHSTSLDIDAKSEMAATVARKSLVVVLASTYLLVALITAFILARELIRADIANDIEIPGEGNSYLEVSVVGMRNISVSQASLRSILKNSSRNSSQVHANSAQVHANSSRQSVDLYHTCRSPDLYQTCNTSFFPGA